MKENDISYDISGAAFKIQNELGPGLLESVYETALSYELELIRYTVKRQVNIHWNICEFFLRLKSAQICEKYIGIKVDVTF